MFPRTSVISINKTYFSIVYGDIMRLDEITRRGFLKGVAGAISVAVGGASLLPAPAEAASKWYHAGTTNIGKWKLFIDLDSIESPEQGVYEFWSKVVDTGSQEKFPGIANQPVRCRIDLKNRTMGEYTGNNITMQKIIPDSIGDAYRDIFLQWLRDKVNLPVPHL